MGIYKLTEKDVSDANEKVLQKFDEIDLLLRSNDTCSQMFETVMDKYAKLLRTSEVQKIKIQHYENL